jgi:pimeloyl-ACP methyl ester carboxylesterase
VHASPTLVPVREPGSPDGVVVVLHGGGSRGDRVMVSPTQLSVLRMVPTARTVARSGRGRLAVYRLLNRYRGWDAEHTPVHDADWAMDRLADRFPGVPIGLVGHSLGGRAALLAGDHESVRSIVALNPWVYPDDDADLSGRRVLVVHGLRDRIASPARAQAVVRNLSRSTDVEFVPVPEGKHGMIGHHREFDGRAAEFTSDVLLSRPGTASA